MPWLQVLAVPSPSQVPDHEHPAQSSSSLKAFRDLCGFVESVLLGKKRKPPRILIQGTIEL